MKLLKTFIFSGLAFFTTIASASVISDAEFNRLKLINSGVPPVVLEKVIEKVKSDTGLHQQVERDAKAKGIVGISELRFTPKSSVVISQNPPMTEYTVQMEVFGVKEIPADQAMIYMPGEQYAYADSSNQYATGLVIGVVAFVGLKVGLYLIVVGLEGLGIIH